MEVAKERAAASEGPAEEDPGAPEQVKEEDGFGENGGGEDGTITSLWRLWGLSRVAARCRLLPRCGRW